jgi:hypothetical protein
MSTLKAQTSYDQRRLLGDRCYVFSTLAINAGGAATVKTTGAVIYSVDGVMYSKAALSAQVITITHDQLGRDVSTQPSWAKYIQPVSTTAYYLLGVNAGGTVCTVQGGYAGQTLTLNGAPYVSAGAMPELPAGYAPIGVIKIAPTVAATFDPGTTLLDAANVNATYFNVSTLPTATL